MMTRRSFPLVLAALALATACSDGGPTQSAAPPPESAPLLSAAPGQAIPGHYIVVLNDDFAPAAVAAEAGVSPRFVYTAAINGFAGPLNAGQLNALQRHPGVAWIEQDAVVTLDATQTNATWGLDRIDQRDLPLNGTYTYTPTGAGVRAYIIDTGIRRTHDDFGGRAQHGYTAISDGRGSDDCNGHGTHVAGTVGGTVWGVAKGATLVAVRVLDCNGSGTNSGVIAGMDWVTGNHVKPAVANMSLGGGASSTIDAAVDRMHNAGVTVVVAAGNSNANACNYSPARAPNAITVGATTSTDARASYSNYGSCLDLLAPGSSIRSAWHTSNTATNTISGTSMASPHVAGVAALYLQGSPSATPATVTNAIVGAATTGKVTSAGSGSPNRLLYSIIGSGGGGNQPPVAAFTYTCSGLTCQFTDGSSDPDGSIASRSWAFGDGTTSTATNPSKTYGASGTYTVTLTVTDNGGATGTTSQNVSVTSTSGAPCSNCEHYSGSLSGTGDWQAQPNGNYYYSSVSGTHRGWLRGPTSGADFDLYLMKWNGFWWAVVAQGISSNSSEDVVYSGTSGYYYWRVESYSGSGAYDFWMQRP
jgi:serine protease